MTCWKKKKKEPHPLSKIHETLSLIRRVEHTPVAEWVVTSQITWFPDACYDAVVCLGAVRLGLTGVSTREATAPFCTNTPHKKKKEKRKFQNDRSSAISSRKCGLHVLRRHVFVLLGHCRGGRVELSVCV